MTGAIDCAGAPRPCFVEQDTLDARHDVDSVGRHTNLKDHARPSEVAIRHALHGRAEFVQSRHDPRRVLATGVNPDVEVLAEAWPGMKGDGVPATSRYLAPEAFNAANRSLKSGLIATRVPPFECLEGHVPDERQPLGCRDRPPELPIELPVVLAKRNEPGRAEASLLSPIH